MKYHIVSDFLNLDEADKLLNQIYNAPGNWWSKAVAMNNNPGIYFNLNKVSDIVDFTSLQNLFITSLKIRALTYKFTRSTMHYATCECYECNFKRFIVQGRIKNIVEKEFNYLNSFVQDYFTSIYYQGDFLGTHMDANKGIAFMYYLTKDWLPEYGGILNILNSDNKTFTAISPEYNSLVLLDVSDEYGIPHFVSEVSTLAPYPRIAISGWFSNK